MGCGRFLFLSCIYFLKPLGKSEDKQDSEIFGLGQMIKQTKNCLNPSIPSFCLFAISRAAPVAYRGSRVSGRIGAVAADLHHSPWQRQILNSLSEARDRTRNLTVPGWIH